MNARAATSQANKGKAAADLPKQNGNGAAFQFKDQRPKTPAQEVIQRYSIVQPGNIKAKKNTSVETDDLRQTRYGSTYISTSSKVTQGGNVANPKTKNTRTEKVSGNQNKTNSHLPPFKVSTNGLLALPARGQAKNFYAEDNKIAQANTIFKNNGATIRLTAAGNGVTVPKTPANPDLNQMRYLKKVHAATEVVNNHQVDLQIQSLFPEVECNDFIKLITGVSLETSRVAVLQNPNNARRELPSGEAQEPVSGISRHVSQNLKTPKTVHTNLTNGPAPSNLEEQTGLRNYETMNDQVRSVRAQKLGINEFVNPEVGEGLVIRTQQTNARLDNPGPQVGPNLVPANTHNLVQQQLIEQTYLNSLQQLDVANANLTHDKQTVSLRVQKMMRSWGQHYAGVVARDGGDMVTLENYNRRTEVEWEHERIFGNLFRDFQAFRTLVSSRVTHLNGHPDPQLAQQLVDIALLVPGLAQNYEKALREAKKSFETGLRRTNRTFEGNFHFAMYGPGDQSFHSEFSSTTHNPVTLHIREDDQRARNDATAAILALHNRIARWETPILAHPMTGAPQATLLATIQHARTVENLANYQLAGANTRGQYINIYNLAQNESDNVFNRQIRTDVMASYQAVTGNAPVPAANDFNDLIARCNAFRNTYYWFNKADTAYNNITSLRNMAQALIAAGL